MVDVLPSKVTAFLVYVSIEVGQPSGREIEFSSSSTAESGRVLNIDSSSATHSSPFAPHKQREKE